MKRNLFVTAALAIAAVFALSGCVSTPDMDVTITVDSNNLQNVIRVTDNKYRKNAISVSPNGAMLLYCEANETSLDAQLYLEDYRIMLLRDHALSSAKTPLTSEPSYGPVWAADNSGFVYVVYESNTSRLIRSNIAGGGKTYITRASAGEADANPNLLKGVILCDILVNGKRQLVSMKENGTEITILGEGEQPSWHPSGDKFVYVRRGEERRGNTVYYPRSIYEMDIKTNQVTQIYTATINEAAGFAEVCSRPSYSPDGKNILFAKGGTANIASVDTKQVAVLGFDIIGGLLNFKQNASAVAERRVHLYLMNGTDFTIKQLTSGNVDVYSPAWGRNNEIFFISNVQGATEIWKARLSL